MVVADTAPVEADDLGAREVEEHAVLITLLAPDAAPDVEDGLLPVEQRIRAALTASRVGQLEDLEIVAGRVLVYAYGPDADALWAVVRPLIRTCDLPIGRVQLRRGWFGSPCTDVDMGK